MANVRVVLPGLLALGGLAFFVPADARPGGKGEPRIETVPAAIHEIQGVGLRSSLDGISVVTEGIVTARTSDGYFLQTPDSATDGLDQTSEGLFVQADALQRVDAQLGHLLRVAGRVQEVYPDDHPHQLTVTRLVDVTSQQVLATGQPLPAPVPLDPADLSPGADLAALERLEGMRVIAAELTVVGATQSFIRPDNQQVFPNGRFHAVAGLFLDTEALPFREPGLSPLDAGTPPAGKSLPVHDGNPEVLAVEAGGQLGSVNAALEVGFRDRLRNVTGVLSYGGARYMLLTDAAVPLAVDTGFRGEGAAFIAPGEVKLVWMDLGGLYDASDDPTRDEPVHSPAVYQARLAKIANGLCTFLLNPEIIAVGAVENVHVLEDLAALIETNPSTYCPEPRHYTALLVEGSDPDGLDLGFLLAGYPVDGLNPRVQVLATETIATGETSAHPDGGSEPLFTRPPLALSLRVTDAGGRQSDFTAVNLRLQDGADADNLWPGANGWATGGDRVMALRARQSARIAAWIEARQQANPDEAIALLGGFEADAFNDGRVDVMGILTGRAAPADQTWVAVPSPVTTPLRNLTELAEPYTRYNANDQGEFRALDHIVVNEAMRRRFAITTAHPRMNADFPASARAAGDPGFTFSARDPLMARLAVAAFIDANTRVEIYSQGTYSPRVDNVFYLGVTNQGPDPAPALELVVESSLSPAQWTMQTSWPGWSCGDVVARAGGSQITCNNARLVESHGFEIHVPADLSLDGGSATFTATLRGGHNDPDLGDNTSTRVFGFDGRVDLRTELMPINGNEDLLPGDSGGWVVIVRRSPLNPPGPVTITLDIDALPAEVGFSLVNGGVTCDAGVATGARRSRFTCTAVNDDFLDVAVFGMTFDTALDDGRRVIGLRAEARAIGIDPTPEDNVATASRRVSDRVDLRVAPPSISVETATLDTEVAISLSLSNAITGVARNARAEILVDLPPEAIGLVLPVDDGARPNPWTCAAPVAHGSGARVACTAPPVLQQPAFNTLSYHFSLRFTPPLRPGLASYPVSVVFNASSDSEEQVPADNAAAAGFVVDQTVDLAMRVFPPGGLVIEPALATFTLQVDSFGPNLPRNPRVRVLLDEVLPPGDITVRNSFGQPVACAPDSAPAGSTALLCPVWLAYPWMSVGVPTNPALAAEGRLALQATVLNDLVDPVPSNDTAGGAVFVSAEADLCVGPSCVAAPRPLPVKLEPDQANTLLFDVANLGPSTARNAVAIVEVVLQASRVTASFNGQACEPAEPMGTQSRVRCPLGDLRGDGARGTLSLGLDTTNLQGDLSSVRIRLQSDVTDLRDLNNQMNLLLPIAPIVDLSARVAAKTARFPAPAMFSITAAADGPETAALSHLRIRIESPGAGGYADLVFDDFGWLCSATTYDPDLQEWACDRFLPIAPGRPSLIGVEVPAHRFIQIGQPIRVTATHAFPPEAVAADRNPGNDSATATHVVDGRSTTSVDTAPEPTPAYGGKRETAPPSSGIAAPRAQTR